MNLSGRWYAPERRVRIPSPNRDNVGGGVEAGRCDEEKVPARFDKRRWLTRVHACWTMRLPGPNTCTGPFASLPGSNTCTGSVVSLPGSNTCTGSVVSRDSPSLASSETPLARRCFSTSRSDLSAHVTPTCSVRLNARACAGAVVSRKGVRAMASDFLRNLIRKDRASQNIYKSNQHKNINVRIITNRSRVWAPDACKQGTSSSPRVN
eukprot:25214-Chlamydomonas_euryale.AAC.2